MLTLVGNVLLPWKVLAEVSINLAHFDRHHMREEWDTLREHDVVFLVSIESPQVRVPRCRVARSRRRIRMNWQTNSRRWSG